MKRFTRNTIVWIFFGVFLNELVRSVYAMSIIGMLFNLAILAFIATQEVPGQC